MIFGEICTEIIGHYNLEQGNLSKWSYMLHVGGEAVGSLSLVFLGITRVRRHEVEINAVRFVMRVKVSCRISAFSPEHIMTIK